MKNCRSHRYHHPYHLDSRTFVDCFGRRSVMLASVASPQFPERIQQRAYRHGILRVRRARAHCRVDADLILRRIIRGRYGGRSWGANKSDLISLLKPRRRRPTFRERRGDSAVPALQMRRPRRHLLLRKGRWRRKGYRSAQAKNATAAMPKIASAFSRGVCKCRTSLSAKTCPQLGQRTCVAISRTAGA